jgi:guanylate kinase
MLVSLWFMNVLQKRLASICRAKRNGEVDGVDYHFVSKAQFEEWIQQGELFEYATVYGEYKGIPKSSVLGPLQEGKDVVLRLDVQGAETVRKLMPRVVSVFVTASSEAELVKRLVSRKTETTEALIERVRTLKQECERISEFEYVIVNKKGAADAAAAQLAAIVDAERCRASLRA